MPWMYPWRWRWNSVSPTVATIAYAKARGATKARTVAHATSGEVSGEYDRVVGYVGMVII